MKKYKICVYAICKNEEKFIERWVKSMSEADEIYVLDTGSTDNSVKKLKSLGVNVYEKKFKSFRFDDARNESLKLIPDDIDICVCTDLDEIFIEGWRKNLENSWQENTTRARYNYNWSLDENNKPIINFYTDKIHSRKNYSWQHPVHEVLNYENKNQKENIITIDSITLNHYPDIKKSRSSYLSLLELSVKEKPNDDRNMHYLGREYMYYGRYEESIKTLKKHLKLKTATWKDERSTSMRFIGRCYKFKKKYNEAKYWLKKAINEAPYLRDPYVEMAILQYELKNYKETEKYCLKALQIKSHTKSYINEKFSWDNTIYDLLSISCYYLKKYNYAAYFIDLALDYSKDDPRLLNNKKIFLEKANEN